MRSSCTIGHWHSNPIRRCVCTDELSCCTHRGNIRCVCSPFSPLSPFPFPVSLSIPHTHRRSNMPLTEILWDFHMMTALLDFDIGSDSTHNNNELRLLNGHIAAKWRIRTHRPCSSARHLDVGDIMTDRMKTKRHTIITPTWNGMKYERSVCKLCFNGDWCV